MAEGLSDDHGGVSEMTLNFGSEETGKNLGTWLPGSSSDSDIVGMRSLIP